MKPPTVIAFLIAAASLPLFAQQQPVPYSITCYTPQNCTATPRPGVTILPDNRPKLADAIATLQNSLAEQAAAQRLQNQANVDAANRKAAAETNARLLTAIDKMVDAAKPKPQPPPAVGQDNMMSSGWANGRMWAAMDETNRLVYLLAVCEGAWRTEGGTERCKGVNRVAMMDWISNFYSYAKAGRDLIPISSVQWLYVHEKSPEEIDRYVNDYLRNIAVPQNADKGNR